MKKFSRKAISILISLCMLISMVPLTSLPTFAASDASAITAGESDASSDAAASKGDAVAAEDDESAVLADIGGTDDTQFQVKIQYTDETVVADTWAWDASNDTYVPEVAKASDIFGTEPLMYSSSCNESHMFSGDRQAYYKVITGYADVAKMIDAYDISYDNITNIVFGDKDNLNLKDSVYGYNFSDPYTDYQTYLCVQDKSAANPYTQNNLVEHGTSLAYVFAAKSEKVYNAELDDYINSADPLADYVNTEKANVAFQNTMMAGRNANGEYGYTGWYESSNRSLTFVMDTAKPSSGYKITKNVVTSTGTVAGGTLTAADSAEEGETVSVTATPADGYYLAQLKADDTVIDITHDGNFDGTGGTFSFTMPASNVELEATFVTEKWDGTLDLTWYDETKYVTNQKRDINMYYPAQWEGLAWICSEDLSFLKESSITLTATSAQDSTKTVAQYMESKGWTHAYQYNTNGNVPLVIGNIPERGDLSLTGTIQTSPSEGDYVIGGTGQNYFSGVTFHVKNDMDFGGTSTDYFKDTTLVSLTSTYTKAASLNEYYTYLGGPNYYPVGSQAKNDGIYTCTTDKSYHFYGIFCGSVDGEGHLMDNIYCDRGDASNVGGSMGGSNYYQSTALIGRLGMADGNDLTYAQNDAIIKDIAVDGFIYGERSIAGIVGKTLHVGANYKIYVKNCINFATIWSTQSKGSGGIVGASWNDSQIYDCVNFGRCINGYTNGCGGVSGSTEADFWNCYNVGMVSLRSGTPASFASQNGGAVTDNCYALVGSTFSGNGNYSTASNPYLAYRLTSVKAIDSLSAATKADFLKNLNNSGRTWVNAGTSATAVSGDVTLKSSALKDALTTHTLFYGYDGSTKQTQTGVANLPIPRAFTEDTATVTSVAKTADPTTTAYIETQTFSTKGMVITANYSDGTSETITDYTVSKTTSLEMSDTSITISGTYKGISYSFDIPITVVADELTSLTVYKNPTKRAFAADEELDTTDMVIKAKFSATGSTEKTLTSEQYTVTENRSENKITISKTYNGKTLTADVPITFLSINAPKANEDGYIEIPNADVYSWFAAQVVGGDTDLNGIITADFTVSDSDNIIGGVQQKMYTGHLDGQNHTITMNTSASSSGKASFIGYVGTDGIVENVKLEGTIKNTQYYAAPIGYLAGGTVRNITSSCTIEGEDYTAGLVGCMKSGTLENCMVAGGTITGGKYTGGIVGSIEGGTITNCGNKAAVGTTTEYKLYTGGVAGYLYSKSSITISGCYNKGSVTNTYSASNSYGTGGCFGYVESYSDSIAIKDCYNTGDVKANYCLGGIAGRVKAYSSSCPITFTNCYNSGTITNYNGTADDKYSGSILGYAYNGYITFTNCYTLSDAFSAAYGSGSNSTATANLASASKASADLLSLQSTLGSSYKAGTDINSPAYPALSWETASTCSHTATTGGVVTSNGDGTHYTTAVVCKDCGATVTEATSATACTYGDWTETKAAACTTAGEKTRTCTACGGTETATIDAAGHSFGEWTVTTPATCTAAGEKTRSCTNSGCTETETAAIAAAGHSYSAVFAWTGTTAATAALTCTAEGCGNVISKEAVITSEITTPATCQAMGTTTYTAAVTVDGTQFTDTTTAQDVAISGHADSDKDGRCDTCGTEMGYYVTVVLLRTDGTTAETNVCLNEIATEGQIFYTGTNRKPDPRAVGIVTQYAAISDILEAASEGLGTQNVYTADCWTLTAYCDEAHTNALPLGKLLGSRCNAPGWAAESEYTTDLSSSVGCEEVPAVLALKSYHTNIYNNSDEYNEYVNDLNAFAAKADYTKAPRLFFGQDISAAANDEESLNFGNLGFNSYSNIDTLLISEVEDAHDEVSGTAVAPTCTKDGKTAGSYCSICGAVITAQETVSATGHAWGEWTVTTPATCTAAGIETRTCANCSEAETREITAAHEFAENGFCSSCGAYNPDAADNGETPAYLITTAAQLKEIARAVNAGDSLEGKTVKLGGNIAAAADGKYAVVEDVAYGTASYKCISDQYYITADASDIWTPIGAATATSNTALSAGYTPFAGTFDGAGYTVSGIYTGSLTAAANTATVQGLFGVVTGTVKNVTVSGCITAKMVAAGVVAYLNGGTVENCTNNAVVFVDGGTTPNGGTENGTKRAGAAGGIVGNAMTGSAISGCTNTADILCVNANKGGRSGGILGLIDGSYAVTIQNCQNSGDVVAYQYAGGIVGGSWSSSAPISGCKNTGKIRATSGGSAYVGGITAYSLSNITNCYNTGDYGITIDGTYGDKCAHMGGIVSDLSGAYVINCYNTGTNFYSAAKTTSATRSSYGGICGTGYGTSASSKITNCYTTVNEGEDLTAGVVTLASKVSAADLGNGFLDSCPNPVLTWETPAAHTVVEDAAEAPTCTTDGKSAGSHCSVCNEIITAQETVSATGHSWGEWTVKTPAACTAAGVETRTCANCSETETREITAIGHNFGEWTQSGNTVSKACKNAGCTETESFSVDFRGAEGESLANITVESVDGENIKFSVANIGADEIVYANGGVLAAADGIYTVPLASAKAEGIATRLIGDADGSSAVTANDAGMMLLAASGAVKLEGANGAAAEAVNAENYSARALRVLDWMIKKVDTLA